VFVEQKKKTEKKMLSNSLLVCVCVCVLFCVFVCVYCIVCVCVCCIVCVCVCVVLCVCVCVLYCVCVCVCFIVCLCVKALGSGDLDMLAAARAVARGNVEIPSSLSTNISTCLRIQQEAARAYGDRDTPANPDPRGAAHSRLQALFGRVLGTVSGGPDPGGDDHGCVTEEQVLVGGGSR
jgi:hypothetical protein